VGRSREFATREGRLSGARDGGQRAHCARSTATPPPSKETASDGTVLLCRSGSRSPAAVASLLFDKPLRSFVAAGQGSAHSPHNWRRCRRPTTRLKRTSSRPSYGALPVPLAVGTTRADCSRAHLQRPEPPAPDPPPERQAAAESEALRDIGHRAARSRLLRRLHALRDTPVRACPSPTAPKIRAPQSCRAGQKAVDLSTASGTAKVARDDTFAKSSTHARPRSRAYLHSTSRGQRPASS
jgi:hypothetical protein